MANEEVRAGANRNDAAADWNTPTEAAVSQTTADPNASRITCQCNQLISVTSSPWLCRDGGTPNNLHLSRVTLCPFGYQPKGWCCSRVGNRRKYLAVSSL